MEDELIANEATESENNKDAPIQPGSKVTRGTSRSKTLQIRLNPEELEALAQAAQTRQVPTSVLARELLLAHIAAEQETPQALIARIKSELNELEAKVA